MVPPRLSLVRHINDNVPQGEAAVEGADRDEAAARIDPELSGLAALASADRREKLRLIEAVLFASQEPLDEAKLAEYLPAGEDAGRVSVYANDGTSFATSDPVAIVESQAGGAIEAYDAYGIAVAAGDWDADGDADVAAGAPIEDVWVNGVEVPHLCQQLCSRGLPNLYVPGVRDFFQVPHLPVLGTGKLDLKGVKDLAQELTRG